MQTHRCSKTKKKKHYKKHAGKTSFVILQLVQLSCSQVEVFTTNFRDTCIKKKKDCLDFLSL